MASNCIRIINQARIGYQLLTKTVAGKTMPVTSEIHTSATVYLFEEPEGVFSRKVPKKWLAKNEIVYPPLEPGDERRPAWVCHQRTDIKYSPQKLWYIACMIRGMSIDEAIRQLSFSNKKGSHIIKETLAEAQELAVREHNVEYKSNLWVAESFVGKGEYIKGYRRHARARFGIVEYKYCHYFVRLEEGSPPKHYYTPELTGNEKLKEYLDEWRRRKIVSSL